MKPNQIRLYLDEHSDRQTIQEQIQDYLINQYKQYSTMELSELEASLTSAANWEFRHTLRSCQQLGFTIKPGDICFIEYGRNYLKEAGYQHFGLIISVCYGKAFVIPMTSNKTTYQQAYNIRTNPSGKRHLFPIGIIPGLNRQSVLFLNDGRYINTARIIDIKAHIAINSTLYKEITARLKECLQL